MNYPRFPMFSMQVSQYPYALLHLYRKLFKKPRYFDCEGKAYEYFEHPYNRTWLNERAVEIPIIWDEMKNYAPQDVLEIGNVMSHYFHFGHTVVDKYEKRAGTIQQDVVDLKLSRRYQLIVSISTLEHVGWDETPRTPGKHLTALDVLRNYLIPGGVLLVTFPLGYNPLLDEDLYFERLGFDKVLYLKRLSVEDWRQTNLEEVRGAKYNEPFRAANALVVGLCRAAEIKSARAADARISLSAER